METPPSDWASPSEWGPAWPPRYAIRLRISLLRSYLDPKNPQYERVEQHDNIKTVITMYEKRQLDGNKGVIIVDGKIAGTGTESQRGMGWYWIEVSVL
jgi:hypothetical protein